MDIEEVLKRVNRLIEAGRHEDAIQVIDNAIASGIKDKKLYTERGRRLQYLGRHSEAIESYNEGLLLEPLNITLLFELKMFYCWLLKGWRRIFPVRRLRFIPVSIPSLVQNI